ncbi:hypothetical protein BSQ44_13765 [Aquibium oceanicum]|uniref:Uncharacterized protein n=1 Tax=Aquibium oceanicum TaxID=1670800 RepID=A0A1L3SSF3_9HYPH|nr:hypothetical protein BSQ44_13765 [Aquibium oceanicum]
MFDLSEIFKQTITEMSPIAGIFARRHHCLMSRRLGAAAHMILAAGMLSCAPDRGAASAGI